MKINDTLVIAYSCPLLASMKVPHGIRALISIQLLIGIDAVPTLFTIVANAALLFTIIKTKSLHKPANCLLAALCSCDLLTGAVTQPAFLAVLFKIKSFQEPSATLSTV